MRMVPYIRLFTTMTTIARPCCTEVASSCPVIRKQPSPANATTGRSGWASLAAIAAGTPSPMVPPFGASCVPSSWKR
jgi:hypothetical protein